MKIRAGFVSNSSSEAFICKSEHSVQETKDILQRMVDFNNEMCETNKDFYDIFEEPRLASEEDREWFDDWDVEATPEDYTSVLIFSASDNTIPWALFDMIEGKFKARRIHLG
jgi:hypothetical protein